MNKLVIILLLLSSIALAGCGVKRVGFKEVECKAEIKLFTSDSYKNSSHPTLNGKAGKRTALAVSVPPMGYIWTKGQLYNDGIRTDWLYVGHEFMHIMHYRCPGIFADPDVEGKEYLFEETPPLERSIVPFKHQNKQLNIEVTGPMNLLDDF